MAYVRRKRVLNFVQPHCEVEVGNHKLEVLADQQVLGLDVSVDEALLVQLVQALQELKKQVADQVVGEPFGHLHQPVQLSLRGEAHHVEAHRVLSLDDAAVVRVTQLKSLQLATDLVRVVGGTLRTYFFDHGPVERAVLDLDHVGHLELGALVEDVYF